MTGDLFTELGELRTELGRTLNAWLEKRTWTPAIDVEHDGHSLTVRAEVPGVKPEDVKIEVQDGILTIAASRRSVKEKKEKNYLRRERRYGSFHRSLALPEGVDASRINATTKDGSLR